MVLLMERLRQAGLRAAVKARRRRKCVLKAAGLGILCWCGLLGPGYAHEVRPAVVDLMFTDGGKARFQIDLNLEALIAGIGPEHGDTSESPNAAQYDALRRMAPADLERAFEQFENRFLEGVSILDQDGFRLQPQVEEVAVDEVGDTDLARSSKIILGLELPPGTTGVVWAWDRLFGANVIRLPDTSEGPGYSAYLVEGGASDLIPLGGGLQQSLGAVILDYMTVGFTHIVPKGLDHILFVVGLFLLSTSLRPLLIQVTSFTLAHSVTLALGALGVVTLSPAVVEPLIAASIVYVAVEDIVSGKLQRWRPAVVFGFGLLHGLGFAGVLTEIGISQDHFVAALASFNVGVELGQLAVIAACFLLVGLWFRDKPWYRRVITVPASTVIAVVGAYWFLQRVGLV